MAKASNPTARDSKAEKSAFLRDLKKRSNELAEAAKKEAGSAFLSDEEVISLLDLSEARLQVPCKLTRVRYGLDKHKTPYISLNYTIADGDHEGTPLSKFFSMGGTTKEDRLKKNGQVCAAFQRLNIDTTKWKSEEVADKLVEAADKLTVSKPSVLLALYTWGDDPKNPRLGIDIVSVGASTASKKPAKQEADDEESEEEQYEDTEESSEDEIDYASYVGYECTYETEEGSVTCSAVSYDEDTSLFTIEDEGGDQYEVEFSELDFGE